ncbi:APC family permease [Altibacter sp. HG106]|uniref:APC family permease n=1 Tax=Altibacter sp. HG106 TaxID=3023937 RepID=UPI00234FDCC4|nr:APC family permease [Altibacter sp. HG106]MDC7994216.1 APC family permease [Altibacter sp. HG106]
MAKKLSQLEATAICGNDISSSCLYVSALAIGYAGQYAWISLLIVAGVLFLFRKIYGEVVGALPLNGGAYNALLNTTKKSTAATAAALTVLSYMATAVISATEAIHYLSVFFDIIPVIPATVVLLLVFMCLTILGIGESSKVAIGIFIFHLISLTLLCTFCGYYFFTHGFETLLENFRTPVEGSITLALFFGFSAAMLGISGFESSANYVEEQQKGVFRKTLRNMWIVVSIFNPLIAFLALAILPMATVAENQEALLSFMGGTASGDWLSVLIGVDAALVLSGAVLTSFVGVGGLMERMTLDRILPKPLLKKSPRNTSYLIYGLFFLLCVSILLITWGDLKKLAGVYTIAFLSVMVLFAIGTILLKVKRNRLPRPERATWGGVLIAMIAVIAAIVGNIILNPSYFYIFIRYLIPTLAVVFFMFYRTHIIKFLMQVTKKNFPENTKFTRWIYRNSFRILEKINNQQFVFFTYHHDVETLNTVMQYIKDNEPTKRLKIVSVLQREEHLQRQLVTDIEVLDRAYPSIAIELIEEHGDFSPEKIKALSAKWNIPINFMFMGAPGEDFPYSIEEMGEVRLII